MEADMSAKKERGLEWRIFDAAAKFLDERKFHQGHFGCGMCGVDASGNFLDAIEIALCPQDAICVDMMGALYGGVRTSGLSIGAAASCVHALNVFVKRRTRGRYQNGVGYSDAPRRTKEQVLRMLKAARDAYA